jgi:peptide/nickel transport system substrate-binding protein
MARCAQAPGPQQRTSSFITLTIGIGQLAASSDIAGVQQLKQILSREGLVNFSEDGRPRPALAEGWTTGSDGRSLTIRLRKNAKFHDGSPADTSTLVPILRNTLPSWMGPAFDDINRITASSDTGEITIELRRPSPLLIEALESPIRKQDGSATGPFMPAEEDRPELLANSDYYLGKPAIDQIAIQRYPTVRAAWADLLRNRIDMLYEVGPDALESLTGASDVSVFTFVRHYQVLLIFNTQLPIFKEALVRRALNLAVDRTELIADGLNGHGVPSNGLVWPEYWALKGDDAVLPFDGRAAAETLRPRKIKFVCLVPPEFERLALVLKRQFDAVGVEMELHDTTLEDLDKAFAARKFDAILTDFISGPSVFRVYRAWHSQGSLRGLIGNTTVDKALDKVRFAASENEYRNSIKDLQRIVAQDPPAVFLAWSQRARAVNRRFDVHSEPNRDILPTLRLWRPTNDQQFVNRN